MDRAGMLLLTLLPMGQGQSALYLKALSEFFFEFALWPLNLPCSEVVSPLAALITTPQDSQGALQSLSHGSQAATCSHLGWLSLANLAGSQLEMLGGKTNDVTAIGFNSE